MSYRIAAPDEYLAVTGMGVKTVKITKSAWVWPLQRCTRFSVQPQDYAMDLQAMTREKLQFRLPVVFTIGPYINDRLGGPPELNSHGEAVHGEGDDDSDALTRYAMLLAQADANNKFNEATHLESIVKGIIEGETRVLVSSMTMEEIFTEREVFKKRIFQNIQSELQKLGLHIYNSNVKELKDAQGSVYFESLSRKAHEGATNQAKIDVAEAQLLGTVGEAKRKGQQDREIAKIHAEVQVQKTERDIERAQAEARLQKEQTALNRDVEIAQVTAQRALESKDVDLRKEVEVKRAAAEMERLRATDVVKATIDRESKQQAADASAYEIAANARATQEASQRKADAAAYRIRAEADAQVFKQIKEAEGIAAMADAYGKLSQSLGGPGGLIQYMMIEKGTYVELAKANAEAIRGLSPKISMWNTGNNGGEGAGGKDGLDTMRNVYQMLPPLMTTINEQTGITLPEWQFGRLNANMQAIQEDTKRQNGYAKA